MPNLNQLYWMYYNNGIAIYPQANIPDPGEWIAVQGNPAEQILAVPAVEAPVLAPVPPPIVPNLGTPEDEGSMINNFRVGCDPEFMLLGADKKTIPASRYFPQYGPVGYDHGGRVAEYRPEPSKGVFALVRKLQTLIKNTKVPDASLRAGAICNNDCLGGHIHFGFNSFQEGVSRNLGTRDGYRLNTKGIEVTRALDALTKVLEHLDILPKNESNQRRTSYQAINYGYGQFGDVRDCNGHMEYRTMASWLYDPRIAFLCLTAAKLAASDPVGAFQALHDCTSFAGLHKWLNTYKSKDVNALRVSEKVLEPGLKPLQIDPSINFKERWEELGL